MMNNNQADAKVLAVIDAEIQRNIFRNQEPNNYSANEDKRLTVNLISASAVKIKPIEWLWKGWLAKGKLHVFAGMAGTGKTTIALGLAATVSKGGRFPDGSLCPKGSVLIWSGEDAIDDTLTPRLIASGAELNKIAFVRDTTLTNFEKASFDPANHMDGLVRAARDMPDLALLILDPIVNAVAGDSHKNGEVRRSLQPIVEFGEKLNCAVLGITHFSKGTQSKEPLERVTGSLAFGALARLVLATAKIKDGDNTKHIFCRAKSNIGEDSGGFEYDLKQTDIGNLIYTSHIQWGQAVEGSARELLSDADEEEMDCAQLLEDFLADGMRPAKEVFQACADAGFSKDQTNRAKRKLGIKPHKSSFGGGWYWDLPPTKMANFYEDGE
jgi:hypothetical protein